MQKIGTLAQQALRALRSRMNHAQRATRPNPNQNPSKAKNPTPKPLLKLQAPEHFATQTWRNQQTRADLQGVCPVLLKWARSFQREAKAHGVPIFILEGKRTPERQFSLYQQGFSQIPYDGSHVRGYALDIIHATRFWDGMQKEDWQTLAYLGKEIASRQGLPLTWGGDWKRYYDAAHWEVTGWRSKPPITTLSEIADQHLRTNSLI